MHSVNRVFPTTLYKSMSRIVCLAKLHTVEAAAMSTPPAIAGFTPAAR